MARGVLGEDRRKHVRAEPLGAGQSQAPFELILVAFELSLKGERFGLDALGMLQHDRAFIGEHEAFRRALKEAMPEGFFQRTQAVGRSWAASGRRRVRRPRGCRRAPPRETRADRSTQAAWGTLTFMHGGRAI